MDMNINDKIDQLDGQIAALTMALQGVILAQPDPYAAAMKANDRIEKFLSDGLASGVPEAYLDGVHQAQKRLLPKPEALQPFGPFGP